MASVNAQVDIGKATLVLDGKEVPLKAWPENAGFTLKGVCKVYSTKMYEILPGEVRSIEVTHPDLEPGQSYYFETKSGGKWKGSVLLIFPENSVLGSVSLENPTTEPVFIQKNECLGGLSVTDNLNFNKDFSVYFLV